MRLRRSGLGPEINRWGRLKAITAFGRFEKFTLLKAEWASDEDRRELLAGRIIFLSRVIIETAGRSDLVFNVSQLILQL